MEDAGTFGAADAHSPDLPAVTQPALAPTAIPKEPQAFRRYQTRMGPRAPSPVPQRRCKRAQPSKRARTSGLGESSRSRPEPSPTPIDEGSSAWLSQASRIRRPMFTSDPIPGNVDLRSKDFHGEPYCDIPALTIDQRFRDSMRLIRQYSFLPFMMPWQFYYPRVVLEFYHTMTSRGVPSPLELRFSIDGRPGVLRAAEITAALGLPAALVNSGDIEHDPSHHRERWSAVSLEILQRDPYSSANIFLHRCSWWTTCSEPVYSHYSIMYNAWELYSRLYTGSQRDSSLVPLSWS